MYGHASRNALPVLVAAGLLKPLGRPAATGSKFFATVDLQALRNDTRCLGKASDTFVHYWRDKNAGRQNKAGDVQSFKGRVI